MFVCQNNKCKCFKLEVRTENEEKNSLLQNKDKKRYNL